MSRVLPQEKLAEACRRYGVPGVSVAVLQPRGGRSGAGTVHTQVAGLASKQPSSPVYDSTWFEIASLSKPIAAAFALEYFGKAGIPSSAKVNPLLEQVRPQPCPSIRGLARRRCTSRRPP